MSGYRHSPLADEAPGTPELVTQWDGDTMGGRVPAFVGLAQRTGGVFLEKTDKPLAVEDAMRKVGLDFEVTLEELAVARAGMNADGEFQYTYEPAPRHKMTVQNYPDGRFVPMAPVGTKYRPIQNPVVANLGQLVVDGGEGSLIAIGAYGEPVGSKVYFAFNLGDFTVGGSDKHNLALTLVTSHDGTGGVSAGAKPVRIACTNQTSGLFGNRFASSYTIRHTESAEGKAQEVREALGLAWKYVDRYQEESEGLLGARMTEHEVLAFEHELFGAPEFADATPRQRTLVGNRDEALLQVWRGPTNEFGRGTRWAAAQSVFEFVDWIASVRGADQETARYERTLSGAWDGTKATTWRLLTTA